MDNKKIKQSVIVAALTSTFGIFISKALGLLYYAPLSALAGESNMAFYSLSFKRGFNKYIYKNLYL